MQSIGPIPQKKGPWRKIGGDIATRAQTFADNNPDTIKTATKAVTKASGPDTIQKLASAGLGLAGWGGAAAAGIAVTNLLQTDGDTKGGRIWNKFVRWGPIGAAYQAVTDDDTA